MNTSASKVALKKAHQEHGKNLSLKEFARKAIQENNDFAKFAKDWFSFKKGSTNKSRTKENELRIEAEKLAKKSSKKK